MFKKFGRWLQLTFLISVVALAGLPLLMGPTVQGDWSRLYLAVAIGGVTALALLPWASRSPAMTRSLVSPTAAAGLAAAAAAWAENNRGGGNYPIINPTTGLPMSEELGVDGGGTPFCGSSDDSSPSAMDDDD